MTIEVIHSKFGDGWRQHSRFQIHHCRHSRSQVMLSLEILQNFILIHCNESSICEELYTPSCRRLNQMGCGGKYPAKIERANRALCHQILCAREQNREHRAPGHALKKGLNISNSSKSISKNYREYHALEG